MAIDYDRAAALRVQGLPFKVIGKMLGCKPATLRVQFSNKGITKQIKEQAGKLVVDLVESETISASSKAVRSKLASITERAVSALDKRESITALGLSNTKEGQGVASVLKTLVESADLLYGWSDQKVIGVIDARTMEGAFKERQPIVDVQAQASIPEVVPVPVVPDSPSSNAS